MNLMPPTGSVLAALRLARRKRQLRALYRQLLANASASADEPLGFHLNHLSEYWSRCLAALHSSQSVSPAFLRHNLVLSVLVGTEMANRDALDYYRSGEAGAVSAGWSAYTQSLAQVLSPGRDLVAGLELAAEAFNRVKSAYQACRSEVALSRLQRNTNHITGRPSAGTLAARILRPAA